MILLLIAAGCTSQKTSYSGKACLWQENGNSESTLLTRELNRNGSLKSLMKLFFLPGSMAENGKGNEVTLNTGGPVILLINHILQIKNMKNTVSRET